jgi:DNA-binding HxlR family transcriptional regulator
MYLEKTASTNMMNKQAALQHCPVTVTLDKIGGRWKALIIYNLMGGAKRYSALKRDMSGITEKMLIQQLKELETDELVVREVKPVVPPHVTYSLSPAGKSLMPILAAMAAWGSAYTNSNTPIGCEI